ncbi:inter-alpha-trypsin inhibitor heavy chain H5 isoform X2 [Rousettus aegyptiacus]|uniref:Inter-alpha-trypsin inhibitor heavy chain 5 n=1 Tax=Rousettus aegyptiacus TaxID=9407 RepID=A0A7J8E884_ROUAE|nr:inter-alpha-trypsin inhibitor heavy chain H5 isoform X2 [Rousettus aegyptiacus]KAF6431402.1 inter-alpha-trypsin inhibitor heavy chain 5 [Rousettus aegyptiacus]
MLLLLALCLGLPLCAGSLEEARSWGDTSEQKTKPLMTEFSVKSTIISRYAFTTVSCRMLNRASEDQDAEFLMHIPASAFITNFTMLVGDKVFQGEITEREKENGDKVKEKRNKTAEDNGEKGPDAFRASAVIPSKGKAVFLLSYEELLHRRLGKYEHVVSVRPQQLVGRLTVEVNILERAGLSSLEVLPPQDTRQRHGGRAEDDTGPPPSTVINQNETFAKVLFKPSVVQQAKIAQNGILGDFIVRYDVNRAQSIGDVQVLDGYFVHYFAPRDLPPLPKNVVFVLDSSASMVGAKLRQTKDALFTILHDLRPQDRFSIIGFSNRIKVWKDHLVAVTPDSIRDGKVYIHHMSPTGGTDINGALQTAIRLLSSYVARNDIEERSVSLVVFLTDGKPTVGETSTARILNNTKAATRGRVCVFTIGIGDDVDFRLLEKLSLENCGLTRRVREEADAGAQLVGFYDEIRTPLLSDIRIGYPPGLVQQATRTFFPNYFNGSEIVIAGKLVDRQLDRLRVEVTASNSKKFVVLKTDVPVEPQRAGGPGPEDNGTAGPNPLERLWSYLTVRELLSSWLQSGDGREKERLRQQAQALAVNSRFLTPFTRMRLKKAPGTRQPQRADAVDVSAATGPGTAVQSPPPGPALEKPHDPRIKVSRTSADGDPHFVVDFPTSGLTVCFNVDGQPGDILRLVSDHAGSGVTVNGQLVGAPAPPGGHKKQRTYFQTITILVTKPARSYLEVTPRRVILDGEDRRVLPCNQSAVAGSRGLELSVSANANVTVTIQGTIAFVILMHLYKKPAAYQRDHLGFYIASGGGLSGSCHGLLGQFLNQEARLTGAPARLSPSSTGPPPPQAGGASAATLQVAGHQVPVVWKQRRIYNGEEQVDCWFARSAGQLLDGAYEDYLAAHPFDADTVLGLGRPRGPAVVALT